MPITISNRNIGSGTGSLFTPLIANNPAFSVELLPVDGRLEQKPFAQDATTEIQAIKVGNMVHGKIVGSEKDITGKVVQINRANGQITSFKVISDGDDALLDPTTVVRAQEHGQDYETVGGVDANKLATGIANESHVMSYSSWLNESTKSQST